jgi:hypothetical protein
MSFQMVMSKVLQGLTWKKVLCYIDDILVFSSTLDEHFVHLQEVFDRLAQANLRLKPEKCTFVAKHVKYLGHVITKDGIEVDEEKTAAVSNFPRPKIFHDVRSFLGLCNYYKRFIRSYGDITAPLNKLLLKDVKFEWTDTCENECVQLFENRTYINICVNLSKYEQTFHFINRCVWREH